MTTWCPACFQNSAPETVDVTINQTTIELGGDLVLWQDDYFEYADAGASHDTLTLTYMPYTTTSLLLVRNGVVQRKTTDYLIDGKTITLLIPLGAAESVKVWYFTAEGDNAETSTEAPVGMIVAREGTVVPDGWLRMDGTTVVTDIPAQHDSYDFLTLNTSLWTSNGTGGYILKAMTQTFLQGTNLVTMNCFIKL